ncbi:hypothetical protein G4B88_029191 [Cannabis sativa]|uniref:Alpha-N-acetylglucosaminidase tim-barrel domain-containing protein n=1 Tax=Cannabis sativa TaxID=3483 RepID=A0A7J6EA48_CANSA|nr:hypothetical protein G4B88_029191 [Cannabis sativa]
MQAGYDLDRNALFKLGLGYLPGADRSTRQPPLYIQYKRLISKQSKEDLNDFFSGPAFLAWARMGNLHAWGGPLSQNWLDNQLKLQKQILSRMLELGMTPVLPSFSGNVPATLKKIRPSANITRLGDWYSIKP